MFTACDAELRCDEQADMSAKPSLKRPHSAPSEGGKPAAGKRPFKPSGGSGMPGKFSRPQGKDGKPGRHTKAPAKPAVPLDPAAQRRAKLEEKKKRKENKVHGKEIQEGNVRATQRCRRCA